MKEGRYSGTLNYEDYSEKLADCLHKYFEENAKLVDVVKEAYRAGSDSRLSISDETMQDLFEDYEAGLYGTKDLIIKAYQRGNFDFMAASDQEMVK